MWWIWSGVTEGRFALVGQPEVLQKGRTGFILQLAELVNAAHHQYGRVFNPDFMECKSMNPLKSIPGTIIAGFVIAIVIALIL